MEKRGQVTIFIIIAIVLIAIVAIFFALRGVEKETVFSPEVEQVKLFVEDCVRIVGGEVIYSIGQGGGYITPSENSVDEVPYYHLNGKSYMPSKEDVETEISKYIMSTFQLCTREFEQFPNLNITQKMIDTKVQINDEEVVINLVSQVSITNEEGTSILKEFKDIIIPVRVGIVYDAIEQIMLEQVGSEEICLSCIADVGSANNLQIDIFGYDDETTIFSVIDRESVINDKTFIWIFANK